MSDDSSCGTDLIVEDFVRKRRRENRAGDYLPREAPLKQILAQVNRFASLRCAILLENVILIHHNISCKS